jgi:hypothetical protein
VHCEQLECGVDRRLGGSEDREAVVRCNNRELIGDT